MLYWSEIVNFFKFIARQESTLLLYKKRKKKNKKTPIKPPRKILIYTIINYSIFFIRFLVNVIIAIIRIIYLIYSENCYDAHSPLRCAITLR